MEEVFQDKIKLRLPVKLGYGALEEALQAKFVGEKLGQEDKEGKETDYVEIQDLALYGSPLEEYDLALEVELKALTSVFKNKTGRIILHATYSFDETRQEIEIEKYKLRGKTNNWFLDKFLQTLVNNLLYRKLKHKMHYNFRALIEEQLISVNENLSRSHEVLKGISVLGALDDFKICEIKPGDDEFLVRIEVEGKAGFEIKHLP